VKRLAVFVSLAFLALGVLGVGSAATSSLAGNLDPSFGDGGVVTSDAEGIGGIAVQPDGKIVVAGTTNDLRIVLARYLPDGSLDPSFGEGGQVETEVGDWAFAESVVLQPDGKIVVAGGSYQGDDDVLEEFLVARYDPNGSLDASFGTGGITNTVIPEQPDPTVATPESATARSLAVLPGGEILVAGSSVWDESVKSALTSFALARYKPDGSLDPTFGEAGISQTASPGVGVGIAVQPDGEVAASEGNALRGYASTGSLNLAFDPVPALRSDDALAIQDGKIVVAGTSPHKRNSAWSLVVARYKANGRVDPTFGTHGHVEIKRVKGFLPMAVLAMNDGKLLIAATRETDEGPADVVRLLRNGRVDTHFGKGGIVSFGHEVGSLAAQEDGKILVGSPGPNSWTLDRLLGGNNCLVPGLRGETVSKARSELTRSYCRGGHIASRFSGKVARGRVITTTPSRGARLPRGAMVDLVISKGKRA
jgi:uncharacterized delta-60 repeat protein